MPVYGVEAYIARAIESVQLQTYTDWELIIVNDGTKDRSREIAEKYALNDSRIRIIDKSNGGLTSARLKGLEFAQGDYLSFIDSDDTLQPEYLEELYRNILKYDADISMCSFNTVCGLCSTPQPLYFTDEISILKRDDIFEQYFLPQVASVKQGSDFFPSFMWLRMFKRTIITEDLFVSERLVYQEDKVLSARIHNRLNKVVVINIPLYNYYVNEGSLTQKYRENAWEMMLALTLEIKKAFYGHQSEVVRYGVLSHVLDAVHFAMMNAARLDYKSFKTEFKQVRNNDDVKLAFTFFSLSEIKRSYIVMLVALKFNCPCILYKYNKKRI